MRNKVKRIWVNFGQTFNFIGSYSKGGEFIFYFFTARVARAYAKVARDFFVPAIRFSN